MAQSLGHWQELAQMSLGLKVASRLTQKTQQCGAVVVGLSAHSTVARAPRPAVILDTLLNISGPQTPFFLKQGRKPFHYLLGIGLEDLLVVMALGQSKS